MKKITFLSLFIWAFSSFSYGQSNLKLIVYNNPNSLNGTTLTYWGAASSTITTDPIDLVNTGATTDTIYVKRVYVSVVGNTTNAICWAGQCYDTTHGVSDDYEIIGPGDTARLGNSFTGDYYPLGQIGTSTIKYLFYDVKRPKVVDTLTINYETSPTGVAQISAGQINFSTPYPNPANSFATFNCSFTNGTQSANLKIFNLIGECVQTLPLSSLQNKANINVQALPSGIYICEVEANGYQPVYQKMVVSH